MVFCSQNDIFNEACFLSETLEFISIMIQGMELEFYLKISTGKSYSNIKITQRPHVK